MTRLAGAVLSAVALLAPLVAAVAWAGGWGGRAVSTTALAGVTLASGAVVARRHLVLFAGIAAGLAFGYFAVDALLVDHELLLNNSEAVIELAPSAWVEGAEV